MNFFYSYCFQTSGILNWCKQCQAYSHSFTHGNQCIISGKEKKPQNQTRKGLSWLPPQLLLRGVEHYTCCPYTMNIPLYPPSLNSAWDPQVGYLSILTAAFLKLCCLFLKTVAYFSFFSYLSKTHAYIYGCVLKTNTALVTIPWSMFHII